MQGKRRLVLYFPQQIAESTGRPYTKDILPLALLQIASFPDQDGYEIVIVDGGLYSQREAHERVVAACDGALLYATTGILGYQVADGLACTRAVKARYPKLPAFIGGWFASTAPKMQLETGLYDAVAIGQGEWTFHDLVRAVSSGECLEGVAGLALWRDKEVVFTAPRAVGSWSALPRTPWHLLDFEPYRQGQLRQRAVREEEPLPIPPDADSAKRSGPYVGISYYSSFGCPLQCTFCCSPQVSGLRWKAMPAERMLDDLQELQGRWKIDVVRFLDANYGVMEKRVRAFAQGLLERKLHLWQYVMMQAASIVRYQPDTMELMAASGLFNVLIGGETGTDETMTRIKKTTRGDENLQAALAVYECGIDLQMTYVIGYPGESEESMLATIDQARRVQVACPGASPMVWHFRPIPGTPLFAEAVAQGYRPPQSLEEWGGVGQYWLHETWQGNVTARAARARRLYHHFAGLSKGVVTGKYGFWEARARRRLERNDFRLARWEAKAFDVVHKITNRLQGRAASTVQRHRIRAQKAVGV